MHSTVLQQSTAYRLQSTVRCYSATVYFRHLAVMKNENQVQAYFVLTIRLLQFHTPSHTVLYEVQVQYCATSLPVLQEAGPKDVFVQYS